jgi:hypothetical protein
MIDEVDEKLTKFLSLVPTAQWRAAWNKPPPVWNEQFRQALSSGFVRIGFGGTLSLTATGRKAAKLSYRLDGSQAWQS